MCGRCKIFLMEIKRLWVILRKQNVILLDEQTLEMHIAKKVYCILLVKMSKFSRVFYFNRTFHSLLGSWRNKNSIYTNIFSSTYPEYQIHILLCLGKNHRFFQIIDAFIQSISSQHNNSLQVSYSPWKTRRHKITKNTNQVYDLEKIKI